MGTIVKIVVGAYVVFSIGLYTTYGIVKKIGKGE